jgi:hypothetical protein
MAPEYAGEGVIRTEDGKTLQEVLAQIERVRRNLLACVEQQSEVARALTENSPAATRGRILLNINGIRARLVAYGEKLNRR